MANIEETIEGLKYDNDIDNEGFIKITAGEKSKSNWFIRVHEDSIAADTVPEINPAYPQLGPLQKITLKTDGFYKRKDSDEKLPITHFFENLRDEIASTVTPTTTFRNLGIID